jgi:hypothetical protein
MRVNNELETRKKEATWSNLPGGTEENFKKSQPG